MSHYPSPGGGRVSSRLVGFGFALVILGWVVLAAALALSDAVLTAGSLVAVLSLKQDVVTAAQSLMVTGLGLALVGAIREGFGALNRFFDAVLQRSAAPRPEPVPKPPAAPPIEIDDEIGPIRAADERASAPPRERNYAIRPDGSVEVDTLLGTRIFATLEEARDFIR